MLALGRCLRTIFMTAHSNNCSDAAALIFVVLGKVLALGYERFAARSLSLIRGLSVWFIVENFVFFDSVLINRDTDTRFDWIDWGSLDLRTPQRRGFDLVANPATLRPGTDLWSRCGRREHCRNEPAGKSLVVGSPAGFDFGIRTLGNGGRPQDILRLR